MTNIELIEELYRAFAAKDYDAFTDICAPEIEWIQNPGFPNGGRNIGPLAVIENVFKAFKGSWESFGYSAERMIDGGDCVVVIGEYVAKHRDTGREVRSAAAHLYEINEGKVTRYRQFADTKVLWDAMGAEKIGV